MTEWSTGDCETNEIILHYTRTGGEKPPMVLLHGLTASGACWTEVAQLLESDFDVIMPDARGHGNSSKPATGYRYADHANDVIGFINALHLSHPILIGHSMGGLTAALAASQHPELLRCLIMGDPTFLSPKVQREVYNNGTVEQHSQYLKMTLKDVISEAQIKHPNRSQETIELISQARLQTSMAAFEILTPPNPDHIQIMSAIDVPCLLVIGGPSAVVSPEAAVELQRINPRLQVEQIPEASHGLHYDQPERFVEIVKSYLNNDAFIC